MIITCKPHGKNLIGAREFRNATSSSPRNRSMYTRPFPSLRVGSRNKTNGPIVLEISKTFSKGIGNFNDLKAQRYWKFQRPYGPMVSEISNTFLPKGIGNFKRSYGQIAFGHKIFEISDTFALGHKVFEISDTFALGHKVFEISNTIGP